MEKVKVEILYKFLFLLIFIDRIQKYTRNSFEIVFLFESSRNKIEMPAYEIGRELRPMRVHAEDKGEKGLQYSLLCISLVSAASSSSMEYMEVMFVRCNTHTLHTYISTRARVLRGRGWVPTRLTHKQRSHLDPPPCCPTAAPLCPARPPPPPVTTVRYSSELHIAGVESWKIMKKTAEPFPAGHRMNGEA